MIVKESGLVKDEAEAHGSPYTVPALATLRLRTYVPHDPRTPSLPLPALPSGTASLLVSSNQGLRALFSVSLIKSY